MKVWNKLALAAAALAVSGVAMADPTGVWRTIDDETGQPKSLVEIYKAGDEYKGRVKQVFSGNVCDKCEGRFHNKNLVGETVIWGIRSQGGNTYGGGAIVDPKNGKNYSLKITDNGGTLNLKAGYSVLGKIVGRSQTWQRVQ